MELRPPAARKPGTAQYCGSGLPAQGALGGRRASSLGVSSGPVGARVRWGATPGTGGAQGGAAGREDTTSHFILPHPGRGTGLEDGPDAVQDMTQPGWLAGCPRDPFPEPFPSDPVTFPPGMTGWWGTQLLVTDAAPRAAVGCRPAPPLSACPLLLCSPGPAPRSPFPRSLPAKAIAVPPTSARALGGFLFLRHKAPLILRSAPSHVTRWAGRALGAVQPDSAAG